MGTYYVKNGGNNSNTGLSDAQAWETITYVNSQNFANDDVICFKRGSTFTDATLTLDAVSSGRSGITVQDYDSGNKPRIDGNSVQPIVINQNPGLVDLTLKNIDISGSDTTGNRCIIQYVNGLTIDGIDYNGHTGSSTYNRCNGISITYVDGDIEIKNCTIQNIYKDTVINSITAWGDLDAHGIMFYYPEHANVKRSGTINVHDNIIHDIYADCIQTAGVHTTTNIYNNTLYNFGESALDMKASGYINVYNNDMYHDDWGLANGGGYYGMSIIAAASWNAHGWTIDDESQQNEVYDNYIHTTKWQGIAAVGKNSKIYRNHFKDVGIGVVVGGYGGVEIFNNIFEMTANAANHVTYSGTAYEFDWSTRYGGTILSSIRLRSLTKDPNTLIYNNTFYFSATNHLYGIAVQADADVSGTIIKNNIIYMGSSSSSVYPLYIEDYDNSGNLPTAQYNNLYCIHSNRVKIEESPGVFTIYDSTEQSDWRTAGHTGALFTDPIFGNPGTGDLTLLSSSPAINAGVNLGSPYNLGLDLGSTWPDNVITLNQDDYGTGWEIGAYVYKGVAVPYTRHRGINRQKPPFNHIGGRFR